MKALLATCIAGAMTFTGMIYLVGGNTPGATGPAGRNAGGRRELRALGRRSLPDARLPG